MALNSSGPISLGGTTAGQSIELENGGSGTSQISLNDTAVRNLAGVASGQITMPTNFWGKSNAFSFNLTSGTDLNLRTQALAAGWNGSSALTATIPAGNVIQSSSTGTPALTVNGSFPSGVTLINNGSITGRGGNAGAGGNVSGTSVQNGGAGQGGGTGLLASVALSINNGSGIISGGGGGGGGGGAGYAISMAATSGGGGGGGGGGAGISNLGNGGTASGNGTNRNGSAGTAGTITANGTGGIGGQSGTYGGNGGAGGALGSNGAAGLASTITGGNGQIRGSGGALGGAGSCVSGNSNITWIANGTRNGPLN